MTKADEIKLLDKVIAQFGVNSYLGPWLADNRMTLIDDISNDVTPSAPMPATARREAAAMLEQAKAEAVQIRADATRKAADELTAARENIAHARESAREQMRRIMGQI